MRQHPGDNATAQDHDHHAQREQAVGAEIVGLRRQPRKDKRRGEDVHIQAIRHRHVRLVPAAVEIAERNQGEYREQDGNNTRKHRIKSALWIYGEKYFCTYKM